MNSKKIKQNLWEKNINYFPFKIILQILYANFKASQTLENCQIT